jgi:hypothetical protein
MTVFVTGEHHATFAVGREKVYRFDVELPTSTELATSKDPLSDIVNCPEMQPTWRSYGPKYA